MNGKKWNHSVLFFPFSNTLWRAITSQDYCLGWRQTSYLEVGLRKTPCHGDHGGGQRTRDADGGQELWDVWRQAKRNRAIGVQVTRGVVDVEAEVGHVELPSVLKGGKEKAWAEKSMYARLERSAFFIIIFRSQPETMHL